MTEDRKQQVLIVDDNPLNIQVLAEGLADEYGVRIATRGRKALDIADADPRPDLILLDVMMPEMDGYTVCRKLKEEDRTKDIPVIFITAKDHMEDELHGLSLGAVDYITKPFQFPIVEARVRTHMDLKRKNDLLEKLALLDGLTEIANRHAFETLLRKEWRRCMRSQKEFSCLMIDIDYFKPYNDHYGHGAGDDCLRRIARAIKDALRRPGDFAARYGGEEFAVLLPETNREGAATTAGEIRTAVKRLGINHEYSEASATVTVSIGAACVVPQEGECPKAFIDLADRMLYKAKLTGRDRVMVRGAVSPA
jgi:diguanylate cyclase (GGDEF)-like protein